MRGGELSATLSAIAKAHNRGGLPERVTLLTQVIRIEEVDNLHIPAAAGWQHGDPEDADHHAHRAYGVYEEAPQVISLDRGMHFERQRETFLHENLHAMLAIVGADNLMEGEQPGLGEHVVATLAPVLLAWLRDNPYAVAYLQEVQ